MKKTAHSNLRFATLDMRGRLRIDVAGAIEAGVYAEEIEATMTLARLLEAKREAKRPIPYRITPAGRKHLDGKAGGE